MYVCSIKTAAQLGLVAGATADLFTETWIAAAKVSAEEFQRIRLENDVDALVTICNNACSQYETTAELQISSVIAMKTESGKYGMFVVKDISASSIQIDACHILL